ncbi:MAG: hypothetical protein HUU57_16965 [Bdellovibrio sp.]|nr:hypothetical protein [Bdellovibrio sp.]
MDDSEQTVYHEREFLQDIGGALNAALFIVDRLTEEIKEEEGRLDTDVEVERLFGHLAGYLNRIDILIKSRKTHLAELLDAEMELKKENFRSPLYK